MISLASIEDIPDLLVLINRAFRGPESRLGWTHEVDLIEGDVRITEEELRSLMLQSETILVKYVNDLKEIIGAVYLKLENAEIYLGLLSVKPSEQGSGIGKQLLQYAKSIALQHKCTAIKMRVISKRTELIEWYQRHGYTATGEIQPFPSNLVSKSKEELNFVILKLDL